MVSTERPSACTANKVHALTASPSTWTTQAPHWLVSQPTCVPVRPSCSRSNCTSNVRPSTVAETGLPFTVRLTVFCIDISPAFNTRPPRVAESLGGVLCRLRFRLKASRRGFLSGYAAAGEEIQHCADNRDEPSYPHRGRKPDVLPCRWLGGRILAGGGIRSSLDRGRWYSTLNGGLGGDGILRHGFG